MTGPNPLGDVEVATLRHPRASMDVMNDMNDMSATSIECGTCVAAGTTACTDCIVTHLLANDDGPVDFVPVGNPTARSTGSAPDRDAPGGPRGSGRVDRVIELFRRAGLVDDPVVLVPVDEFERHGEAAAFSAH